MESLFTSALVADASGSGVGNILKQRASDGRIHHCAFFPGSSKRNYDVGNREHLVVKLALEEWRHWLWTDYRNLYLRTVRRLNPKQAKWVLFIG